MSSADETTREHTRVEEMVFGRRFRATERIGSGGMADVYKAVDETLGRTVAVKVLHQRYAADPTFAARFRQEASAAANLQSPNIVNIYDWGQDGDTYYIVMELVRGTDLKAIIGQKGALDSARVADIGQQVCSALSVAHGYDVIHRDIKPHNIMVAPDGSVKVMDFGIARAGNTTMTQTGSVLGTAHYVSPEQAQGRELKAQSDLYSLGIVLYEAATGKLPFDADTPVAVALKQVNEQPPAPSTINPQIDPGLEAVIAKAMSKQPADRYATAEEMRRDLLRVAQGRAVEAAAVAAAHPASQTSVMPQVGGEPYGAQPRATDRRPAPTKRPVWPWILVAVVLVVAGLGVAWYMGLIGSQGKAVPNLVGKTQPEATALLQTAGFKLGEVKEAYNAEVAAGIITDQSPVANALAEKDSAVDITVSLGTELVDVPMLIGLDEAAAQAALTDAGLSASPLPDAYSSETEAGKVLKQTPDPGEQIAKGSAVQYVVSRGVETAKVPDVRGQSKDAASSVLTDAGFKVAIKGEYNDKAAVDSVIRQNPSQNLMVAKGSTVTIVISKGAETIPVPDVIGQAEAAAKSTLEKAGFVVAVTYEPHALNGTVLNTDPAPGGPLKRGSTVTIVVDGNSPPG